MAEQRRGGGGSSNDPFYNRTVQFGKDSEVSFATIIMAGVAFLFFTGSTFLSGLMSWFGVTLFLVALVLWGSLQVAKMGIWKAVSMGVAFFIATMFMRYMVFDYIPSMVLDADMSKWEQVGDMMVTNSPVVNAPMQGVTSFDSILDTAATTITSVDPNVGGGATANVDPTIIQPTPPPYVAPTPSPTAGLETQLEQAILNNDGAMVLELTGQILTIDPNHASAKVWNEKVIAEKNHADNLSNMPKPTGDFMASASDANKKRALDLLGSNGEMRNGYMYTVLDNGATTSKVSCNETATLQLDNGLWSGVVFTTQRCLVSSVAGSSDNGTVFTV